MWIIPYNAQCNMASGRKRPPRYTLDVHFASEQEKEAFTERLKAVRQLLTPAGSRPIDNCSLLNALFDAAEGAGVLQPTAGGSSSKSFMRYNGEYTNNNICSSTKIKAIAIKLLPNCTGTDAYYEQYATVGIYTGNDSPSSEPSLFVTEKHCFQDLVSGLGTPCSCGMTRNPWVLESVIQVCECTHNSETQYINTVYVYRKAMLFGQCLVVAVASVSTKHGLVHVCLVDTT